MSDSGSDRRPRDVDGARIQVGVVGEERLAVLRRPAGQAGADRDLLGQDHLGVAVAGQDGGPHAALAVDPVDGQVVVPHHGPEAVGDPLQDDRRVARAEERLVHVQERALAGKAMLQLLLLARSRPMFSALTSAWAAKPAKIRSVVRSSSTYRSTPFLRRR